MNKYVKIGIVILTVALFVLGSASTATAIADEWEITRPISVPNDDDADPLGGCLPGRPRPPDPK